MKYFTKINNAKGNIKNTKLSCYKKRNQEQKNTQHYWGYGARTRR